MTAGPRNVRLCVRPCFVCICVRVFKQTHTRRSINTSKEKIHSSAKKRRKKCNVHPFLLWKKKRKKRGFHRLANARAVSRSVRVTWSRRDEWDRTLCWRQLKTLKNRIVYFTLVNSFFPLVGLLIALAFRGFFYCLAIYGIIRYILLFFVLISSVRIPFFFFFHSLPSYIIHCCKSSLYATVYSSLNATLSFHKAKKWNLIYF